MKKISFILFGVFGLLFSTSVNADCIDYATCPISIMTSPFDYITVVNSVRYTDNNGSQIDFFSETFDDSDYTFSYAETGFGRYSDGSIIPSYRFTNYNSYTQMHWYRNTNSTTDPSGNVEVYTDIDNARRIDISKSWVGNQLNSLTGVLSWRFDFAIHFDFYDSNYNVVNNDYTKFIFNGIYIDSDDGITCTEHYDLDTYMINATCRGMLPKTFNYYIIFDSINDYTTLANSSSNYNYRAVIGFSEATMRTDPSGRIEDLIMNDSPNGNNFNHYYENVEIQSNSYFDKFNNFDFDGLSNVVLAPLQFVRSLSSSNYDIQYNSSNRYSCISDPLKKTISIFNHSICIPSGAIFWNRGRDIMSYQKELMLIQFRQIWNILLGGFIIYLLCVKLFKVCLNAIDPHKEGIETL